MLRRKRVVLYVTIGVIAGLALTVYLPWYAVGPGPARAVQPLIRFGDRTRYESQGSFVMTSVRLTRLTGFDMLLAWLDPDRAVVARSVLYPDGKDVQVERERSISQMDSSKLDASAVVLRALEGYPKNHGDGVLIESVVSGCAADGELFPGDRILSIDGEPVDSYRDASRAIEAAPSGSSLTFDLSVDGDPETVDLVREPCGDSRDPLVGVRMINSFPFQVSISSGEIGGPSAGLMWALGLYDLLTPGDPDRRHRGEAGGGRRRRRVRLPGPPRQHGGREGIGRPRAAARASRHIRRRPRVPARSIAGSVLSRRR